MYLVLSDTAQQDLQKLDAPLQKRILDKLEWYECQKDPLSFAQPLSGLPGMFRFRIGAYRAILRSDGVVLLILRIRKRSEAYR